MSKEPRAPKVPKRRPKKYAARETKALAPSEHKPLRHAEVRTVVIGLMLTMFLGALDQTIVATALPTMGRGAGMALTRVKRPR